SIMKKRLTRSVEYYITNISDLILEVPVPQPQPAPTPLENVGQLRNRGLELSLAALVVAPPGLTWWSGLVFAAERNKILNLGPHTFLTSGIVSGQGQSDTRAERLIPGHPLGTFYGPGLVGRDPTTGYQVCDCPAVTS